MSILKSLSLVIIIFGFIFVMSCNKVEEGTFEYYIEKNRDIENISYKITAEYNEPEYAKSEGEIWKKKGLTLQKVDFSGSEMKMLIDSDNKTIITYMIEQKSANKRSVKEDELLSNDPFGVLYKISEKDLSSFKNKGIKDIDGEKYYLFSGKVSDLESERYINLGIDSLNYKVYFSKSNNVLRKIEMTSDNKILTEINITSVKLDKVSDENVKLNIPDSIKIQGE